MLDARHDTGEHSDYFTKGDLQEFKNRGKLQILLSSEITYTWGRITFVCLPTVGSFMSWLYE